MQLKIQLTEQKLLTLRKSIRKLCFVVGVNLHSDAPQTYNCGENHRMENRKLPLNVRFMINILIRFKRVFN